MKNENKNKDIDISHYVELTNDCLHSMDSDTPAPQVEQPDSRSQFSTNRFSKKYGTFVVCACSLLVVNLAILGFYRTSNSKAITEAEANEQLKTTFLDSYQSIDATQKFLAATEAALTPRDQQFLMHLDEYNEIIGAESEDEGFKPRYFRFLGDSFTYLEPDS